MIKIHYASVVGSLMHTMVCTRPDITYAISVVSRFSQIQAKSIRLLLNGFEVSQRYFQILLVLWKRNPELYGYLDVSYASVIDTRKFTSGYMMTFVRAVVLQQSRLQNVLLYLQLKHSTWLLSKEVRNSYGYINFYNSWA